MVQALDVITRVGAASSLVGLALLLLRDGSRERVVWLFLLLVLCLCGFLAGNTPEPSLALSGGPATLARLFSGSAALFLWLFALAVFDDDFRLAPPYLGVGGGGGVGVGVGGVWLGVMLFDRMVATGRADELFTWVLIAMATGMVGHIGFRLIRDLEGDLVEARRNARAILAGTLAVMLLVDVGVDVLFGFAWKEHWFAIAQNGALLLLAALLANWLLTARVATLTFRVVGSEDAAPVAAWNAAAAPVPVDPDARLRRRLRALIESERIYRDPELTFSAFVRRMAAPEADVRRLINERLGHGHFRNFLNAYRVDEARRVLADPANADRKLVAVAFDSGFASLASFNRAFKLAEGRTPTEFRNGSIGDGGPAVMGSAST